MCGGMYYPERYTILKDAQILNDTQSDETEGRRLWPLMLGVLPTMKMGF